MVEQEYDKLELIALLSEHENNNVIKNNENLLKIIYKIIEGNFQVTPTLLEQIDLEDIDGALDIVTNYLGYKPSPDNPLYEMQSVVSAKMLIAGYKIKNAEIEDIDFF